MGFTSSNCVLNPFKIAGMLHWKLFAARSFNVLNSSYDHFGCYESVFFIIFTDYIRLVNICTTRWKKHFYHRYCDHYLSRSRSYSIGVFVELSCVSNPLAWWRYFWSGPNFWSNTRCHFWHSKLETTQINTFTWFFNKTIEPNVTCNRSNYRYVVILYYIIYISYII